MLALQGSPVGRLEPIGSGPHADELAFVPSPLPRALPLSAELVYALDEANLAVGTLVGVAETLPNPQLLIGPLMRREAVLSSRIEGTVSSLSDLFQYEADRREQGDVVEVYNYLEALEESLRLMRERNLPISMRLMNAAHAVLMRHGVRGHDLRPGAFRDGQVLIGSSNNILQARFVPPPARRLRDLIYDVETFANDHSLLTPPLVMCGMLHYQFETVHPYTDGNGRIGRLLIILFLYARGILPAPLLHLSAYFEQDRGRYYDGLYNMSVTGDWEAWLLYFLEGVRVQARDTLERGRRIRELRDRYVVLLQERRAPANDYRMLDDLFHQPITTFPRASAVLGITNPGARNVVGRLINAGILRELPSGRRRLFVAHELMDVLQSDILLA
ncbi:MAG: Fic family protein [Chloroflexota bacterium]|nr:Fic family protein [Chloroflexota bacterium]MDE2884137.1 Fic family protein [Chloroflexota bacterium]